MRILIALAIAGFFPWMAAAVATVKPAGVSRFKPGLAHVVALVNGEQTAVAQGQILHAYKGDNIIFVQAESRDPTVRPSSLALDVEGFASSGPGADDRGLDIPTASLDGRVFPVIVRKGETVVGQIKLVVVEPRFDYAVIQVNSTPVTVRSGGKVALKSSDSVRVLNVRTNIPDPSKVEVDGWQGAGVLRFKYRGRVFGEIRIPVVGARAN